MTSENVVGYNTVTINKAWTIVGINFIGVGNTNISIQDAVPYASGMTKGTSISSGDNIQIQTAAGGYDIYFMCSGKSGKTTVSGGDGKWVLNGKTVISDATLAPGTAFWYKAQSYATPFTLTVAGQVLNTDTTDSPITLTWKHIANPYAADLALNDGIPYTTGMTKGTSIASGDNIQIQTTSGGYDIYFMCSGKSGKTAVTGGDGKWVKNGATAVTTDAIPVGQGAWYLRRGSTDFTIPILKPYSL